MRNTSFWLWFFIIPINDLKKKRGLLLFYRTDKEGAISSMSALLIPHECGWYDFCNDGRTVTFTTFTIEYLYTSIEWNLGTCCVLQAAAPRRWKAFDGKYTEMDTPYTIRARELKDIYNSLNMKYLTQDERLDVLLTLKHTVKVRIAYFCIYCPTETRGWVKASACVNISC